MEPQRNVIRSRVDGGSQARKQGIRGHRKRIDRPCPVRSTRKESSGEASPKQLDVRGEPLLPTENLRPYNTNERDRTLPRKRAAAPAASAATPTAATTGAPRAPQCLASVASRYR